MGIAIKKQSFQDWITQQWVILLGQKIDKSEQKWLLGPFGELYGIGLKFIKQLADKEHLEIDTVKNRKELIHSIHQLNLSEKEIDLLSPNVIDFYQNTSDYQFKLKVKWNPFFKIFGFLLRAIFSRRIEQLNVPIRSIENAETLTSEIIHLKDPKTNEVKRTIWVRAVVTTGQIVYLGVYETCVIPSGKTCIKAIFPLPNGSATVILTPKAGNNGELILESAGNQIGDSGFYFLVKDSKGQLWTKYIKSFKDKLVVRSENENITATQILTLWNLRVLKFDYQIKKTMKILISSIIFLFLGSTAYAQIGAPYATVKKLYGIANYPGLGMRVEGSLLVEDIQVSKNEVRMIMYNTDSVVVGVGIGYADSSMTEAMLNKYILEELKEFEMDNSTKMGSLTYKIDKGGQKLILLNSKSPDDIFPLIGVVFMTDPNIIKDWIRLTDN